MLCHAIFNFNIIHFKNKKIHHISCYNFYLSKKRLKLVKLDSDISWIDTGTYDSLIQASKYFQDYENSTSKKVACIEEIALNLGYIDSKQLRILADSMKNSNYGKYLLKILSK